MASETLGPKPQRYNLNCSRSEFLIYLINSSKLKNCSAGTGGVGRQHRQS